MCICNVFFYVIVLVMIEVYKVGLSNIIWDELEVYYMVGGYVEKVVYVLVFVFKVNIELFF